MMALACMLSMAILKPLSLSTVEKKLVEEVRKNHAANLKLPEDIVNINSGSLNIAGVKAVGDRTNEYRKIGFMTEWVAQYVDCIDGLGASGNGAHAPGEIINLNEWPKLTERAALFVYRLTR
jgi:hypothetical protein